MQQCKTWDGIFRWGGCGIVEYCSVSGSLAYSRILYEHNTSNISTLYCPKVFAALRVGWAQYSWVFLRTLQEKRAAQRRKSCSLPFTGKPRATGGSPVNGDSWAERRCVLLGDSSTHAVVRAADI